MVFWNFKKLWFLVFWRFTNVLVFGFLGFWICWFFDVFGIFEVYSKFPNFLVFGFPATRRAEGLGAAGKDFRVLGLVRGMDPGSAVNPKP